MSNRKRWRTLEQDRATGLVFVVGGEFFFFFFPSPLGADFTLGLFGKRLDMTKWRVWEGH